MRDLRHHDATTTINHPRAAAVPRRIHDMMISEAHASISLLRRLGRNRRRRRDVGVDVDASTDDDDDDDDPRPTTVYLRVGGAAPPGDDDDDDEDDEDDDDDDDEGGGGETAGIGAAVRLVPIPAGRRPRRSTENDDNSSADTDPEGYDEDDEYDEYDAAEALYLDPLLLRALLILSSPGPQLRRGRSLPVRLLPRSSSRSRGGRVSTTTGAAGTAACWGWLERAYVDDDDDRSASLTRAPTPARGGAPSAVAVAVAETTTTTTRGAVKGRDDDGEHWECWRRHSMARWSSRGD